MTGSRSAPGYAVLAVLLAATAVIGAALVAFEAPDTGPPASRFASAESSVLCSGINNPVATTSSGSPSIDVNVVVSCDDQLPSTVAVEAVRDGQSTTLYRLAFSDDGTVTAQTPHGPRTLPHADPGGLGIATSSDGSGYDWVLTAAATDTSSDDPLGDGPSAGDTTCTPGEDVVCVDAEEGVRVSIPGTPGGGPPGDLTTVGDLVAAVKGNVSELEDGGVEDVRDGRFCRQGGSLVRDHTDQDPTPLEERCLFAVHAADENVTTVVGRAKEEYQDVSDVVFHEKTLTVDQDGEPILTVTIPNPEDVPNKKPAVTVQGQGSCTYVTEQITISMGGTDTDPCAGDYQDINVTGPDGGTSASVERLGSGRYRVGTPVSSVTVEAAAVEVVSDPADADAETVVELLTAAGDTSATLTVQEPASSLVPNETEVHVARTVENQTGVDLTKVVSDLLVIEDHDGDGNPERVGAFPGRTTGNASLHMAYDEGDWTVATPGGSASLQGAEVTVAPDAADPGTVHVLLRDADGTTLARFTLEGHSTPPTVEYSVEKVGDGTVAPPVSVEPGPKDPESVSVFGPDGDLLLVYEENGPQSTVKVPPADESRTVDRRTLRIVGHPIEDAEWTLAVQGTEGRTVYRYTVNRPNYEQAVRRADRDTPGDLGPVVSVVSKVPETTETVDFLDYVTDGENRHADDAALDGTHWMSGRRPLTFDASFEETTAYDRFYVRYSSQEPVPLDAPRIPLAPVEDGDERNRTGSVVLANRSAPWDGQVLHFEVVAERRVGQGLVAYARVDNRTDTPYGLRVDTRAPTATLSSPESPDGATWLVTWQGQDTGSGVSSFEVQVDRGSGWEHHLGPTTGRSVQFSGQADTPYRFRARATDAVGHPGPWSTPSKTTYDAPEDTGTGGTGTGTTGNQAPTVSLVSPSEGATLEGIVEVRWSADDPDGTAPAVNLYVSSDGGTTWSSLRTTSDRAYWHTSEWPNRDSYQIRVVADDGSLTDSARVTGLTVDNPTTGTGPDAGGASPGGGDDGGSGDGGAGDGATGGPGGNGTSGQGSEDGSGDGGNGIPGPSLAAALAAAGAAALARRRRRR